MPRWHAIASALLLLTCSSEGLLLESRGRTTPVGQGGVGGTGPETPAVGGLEVLIPRQADSFVNSVGVTFGVNNEYEVGIAREALLELRVRHVRGFAQALPDLEFRLTAELAGEELRLLLVVDPRLDVSGKDIPRLVSAHPTLESIEGPNDFDAYGIDLTSEWRRRCEPEALLGRRPGLPARWRGRSVAALGLRQFRTLPKHRFTGGCARQRKSQRTLCLR